MLPEEKARVKIDKQLRNAGWDIVARDEYVPNSTSAIKELKKVAVDLLKKIKGKIAELDHWTDKPETKAVVDNLIRDTMWAELPESYDDHAINQYRMQIYEYVYTRYRVAA